MPSAEDIRQRIESAIPGAQADVEDYTGTGDHFSATVTATAFEGLSRVQQHRLLYQELVRGQVRRVGVGQRPGRGHR